MTETTNAQPRLKEIFNLGIKAPDAEAESEFFSAFNPDRTFFMDRSKSTAGRNRCRRSRQEE